MVGVFNNNVIVGTSKERKHTHTHIHTHTHTHAHTHTHTHICSHTHHIQIHATCIHTPTQHTYTCTLTWENERGGSLRKE